MNKQEKIERKAEKIISDENYEMRIDESSELDESSGEETSDSGSEEESHLKTPKKKARPWRGAKTPTKVIFNFNKYKFKFDFFVSTLDFL